jgi:hypothetical protein
VDLGGSCAACTLSALISVGLAVVSALVSPRGGRALLPTLAVAVFLGVAYVAIFGSSGSEDPAFVSESPELDRVLARMTPVRSFAEARLRSRNEAAPTVLVIYNRLCRRCPALAAALSDARVDRALGAFRLLKLASPSDLAYLRTRFTSVPLLVTFDGRGRERGALEGRFSTEEILALLARSRLVRESR